jgi:hypothetical protein
MVAAEVFLSMYLTCIGFKNKTIDLSIIYKLDFITVLSFSCVGYSNLQGLSISEMAGGWVSKFFYRVSVLTGLAYCTVDYYVIIKGNVTDLHDDILNIIMASSMNGVFIEKGVNFFEGIQLWLFIY